MAIKRLIPLPEATARDNESIVGLYCLPAELLLLIGQHLSFKRLKSLSQTCRYFHDILNTLLLRTAVILDSYHTTHHTLNWGVDNDRLTLVKTILKIGRPFLSSSIYYEALSRAAISGRANIVELMLDEVPDMLSLDCEKNRNMRSTLERVIESSFLYLQVYFSRVFGVWMFFISCWWFRKYSGYEISTTRGCRRL